MIMIMIIILIVIKNNNNPLLIVIVKIQWTDKNKMLRNYNQIISLKKIFKK